MDVDIVVVGAGVASLATVLRLLKRVRRESPDRKPHVAVIEKGKYVGAHILSGALIDPEPLGELLSKEELDALPVETTVRSEAYYRLTKNHALKLPWIPPPMRAKRFPLGSLVNITQYLDKLCEAAGAEIYAGFAVTQLLMENGRVVGVRLGDKGVSKKGEKKPSFVPGPNMRAKVVVLGEGACGIVTEPLIKEKGMSAPNPQTYAVGVKEVIESPSQPIEPGTILHTFGYPQDYHTYGGGFLYCLNEKQVALGLVTALDYRDASINPHDLFRAYKAHPLIQRFVRGGKVVGYGAKLIPEGGYHSVPKLVTDGALIVGDGAGLLDSLRIKGIHIAIQSGIAAGDALFECWQRNDFSASALEAYPRRFHSMSGWKQMKRVRNVRACFTYGTIPGLVGAGLSIFSGGLLPAGKMRIQPDFTRMRPLDGKRKTEVPPADHELQMDRLADVFFSGTQHDEDQPPHIRIPAPERCAKECIPTYGAPCTLFCPAQVYNLEPDGKTIRIDFANCLHCETCLVKDPIENIEWKLPEGEGGPRYSGM